jgi:tetratricopeptide (TPR) repeat protein
MDRQHRHDLKHDKFVDEIGALSVRARDNQRLLLIIGLSLVGLAVLVYGFFLYRGNREKKAQDALALAIETIEAQVGETPQGTPPPANAPKFKTAELRNAEAEKQFRDLQAKYSGTDASDVAGLYLARMAVAKGDTKAARQMLEEFIGDHGDTILVGSARYSLYQLRIDAGEAAQVVTELNAELNKAEPVLPGDSLLVLLAHAYDMQGNSLKARETFRRLSVEYPDSPYVAETQRGAPQA